MKNRWYIRIQRGYYANKFGIRASKKLVEGYQYGEIGIRKEGDVWKADHIPTGMGLGIEEKTRKAALEAARKLDLSADPEKIEEAKEALEEAKTEEWLASFEELNISWRIWSLHEEEIKSLASLNGAYIVGNRVYGISGMLRSIREEMVEWEAEEREELARIHSDIVDDIYQYIDITGGIDQYGSTEEAVNYLLDTIHEEYLYGNTEIYTEVRQETMRKLITQAVNEYTENGAA